MNFSLLTFLEAMSISFSLIIAIGIQNAFILKQGILRNHNVLIPFLCASIDTVLITLGVYGLGSLIARNEFLLLLFGWGGVLYIFGYSIISFYNAFKNDALSLKDEHQISSIKAVITKIFLVSIVNPNAILDAFVLMGSISAQYPKEEHLSFVLGASTASFVWFFALSLAARFLKPIFTKPKAWKILDIIIGCTMLIIGISVLNKLKLGF